MAAPFSSLPHVFLAGTALGVGATFAIVALWLIFIVRRVRGRPVRPGLTVVPMALTLGGGIALATNPPSDLTGWDLALTAAGCALSLGLGVGRGLTVEFTRRDRGLWFRYTRVTLLLWVVLVVARVAFRVIASEYEASSSTAIATLIVMLGITLLGETITIARRARRYLLANAAPAWRAWLERQRGHRRWSGGSRNL